MSALRILFVLAVAASLSAHPFASKERDWQTGTVLDPQHSVYFTASTNDPPYGGAHDVPLMKVYDSFLLEGANTVYFVREGRRFDRHKAADLKVGAPVKFAIVGEKMFVLDDNGKEHQMVITKQEPKH